MQFLVFIVRYGGVDLHAGSKYIYKLGAVIGKGSNQIFFFQYPRPYIPQIHRIELGAAQRAETPEGAIYSNVTIGRR